MSFRTSSLLFVFTGILLIGILFSGCANYEYWSKACDPCIEEEPSEGELIITFLIGEAHPKVPYSVYEGTMESGTLLFTDTATTKELSFTLPSDKIYTVAATYFDNQQTIVVVNADKISTNIISCTDPEDTEATFSCWYVVPAEVDVRLIRE